MNYQTWAGRSLGMIILLMALGVKSAAAEIDSTKLSSPKPLPNFSLLDGTGKPFLKKDFEDRWSIILMGYTNCPDVCPFTLQNIGLVYHELKALMTPERLPQVVFLAVDPERDKENLAAYVEHFDPSFRGVTGSPEELKTLVEGLDGFYRLAKKSKEDDAYTVRHSARVSIINPDGKVTATLNPPMEPVEAARYVATVMRDYNRAKAN